MKKSPETWEYDLKNGFMDEGTSAADYTLEICF
jgi:hypothetical protein